MIDSVDRAKVTIPLTIIIDVPAVHKCGTVLSIRAARCIKYIGVCCVAVLRGVSEFGNGRSIAAAVRARMVESIELET